MPRADLILMVLNISMCVPKMNATRTVDQALPVARLEKSLLAGCTLELHLMYYRTFSYLFEIIL